MLLTVSVMLLRAAQLDPLYSDVACIVDRVPETVRALILDEVGREMASPARIAVSEAANACAAKYAWSTARSNRVEMLAVARLVRDETRKHLDRNGIAVTLIDEWFDDQSREVQTDFQLSDSATADLLDHLVGRGVEPSVLAANLRPLGHYLGSRMSAARVDAGSGSAP